MTISRGCAPCSASEPSIGCREPISPIVLRGRSRCVIWVRASRIGCGAIRSMPEERHALALDMVRLEWAHIEAFDSAAEKALGPEDLIELGPDFRAGLQPYIRLLAFEYPVDNLRIQVNRASEEHEDGEQCRSKAKASQHGAAGDPVET